MMVIVNSNDTLKDGESTECVIFPVCWCLFPVCGLILFEAFRTDLTQSSSKQPFSNSYFEV